MGPSDCLLYMSYVLTVEFHSSQSRCQRSGMVTWIRGLTGMEGRRADLYHSLPRAGGEVTVHGEYKTWEKSFQDGGLGNGHPNIPFPRSWGGVCTVRAYSCDKVSYV